VDDGHAALVAAGKDALRSGDWEGARAHFEAALSLSDGEALVGEALVGEALVGEALVGEALVGEALVGEALVGEALVGEALVGEALVGEALVGEALVGEALVGEALVGEALVGESVVPGVGEALGGDVGEALGRGGRGAALEGLAQALFSAGDYAGAIDRGEQAFAAYRAGQDDVAAAGCARFVGYLQGAVYGNSSAMSGWLGRAVRLIEAAGDCPERARIELTLAVVSPEPLARERHLAAAYGMALRCGQTDLVFDAMSQQGLNLVAGGDIDAGMALLDEALAAVASGEVHDLVSVGSMYCKMLHACELTSDIRRAEDWLTLADRFVERTNRIPISAICRTHYGAVLTAAGRWDDAERELATSIELYDRSFRALRGAAVVRLADLRVRQGRLAEAAQLLTDAEHDSYAIRPQIELHLARGEADLAVARIERFFRAHPASELAAPILLLLVRAQLAQSQTASATAAYAQLRELAERHPHPLNAALADYADGLTLPAGQATPSLEKALTAFAKLGLPLEEARARLDLASVLAASQPAMAVAEARVALQRFQALNAIRDADAAMSLLRRLGVRGHTASRGDGLLTAREEEVLELLGQALSNTDIASRLFLSRRTVEHHVSNVLAKLGLANRAEATAFVVRRGGTS
jgi:DNA-binding CsgD family transcriptional regulator